MIFIYIFTLFITLSNIYLVNCDGVTTVRVNEGNTVLLICSFHINDHHKKENLIPIWKYPNEENIHDRIKEENLFFRNSFFSYLEIKNVTKPDDEGKYICTLFDIDIFLIEKQFELIVIDEEIMYDSDIDDENINGNNSNIYNNMVDKRIISSFINKEFNNVTENVDYNFIRTTTELNKIIKNNDRPTNNIGETSNKALVILCVIGVLILQFGAVAVCIFLIRRKRRRNIRNRNNYR
ncbi:uncharacterized protein LOC129612943 [Condylostylus longicornis]|uniref:uncharacterized protein LOC129612943 n=1 Tax=Condylostylus longicornis TaxID=2530218 RepID=UPI00244DB5DB|nr:uncharacterized protein LOC129612943 [Condylostylus longicornis]